MKKMSHLIAVVLVLVMLASSFTGCTFFLPYYFADGFLDGLKWAGIGLLIDIAICVIGGMGFGWHLEAEPDERTTYLAGARYSFTDYSSLMERLSEEEIAALSEKLSSLPETKLAALSETVYSLPQTEIAASIERLNSLSDAKLASVVREFNALSEADFDTLADKLKERLLSPAAEYVAALTRGAYSFALASP
jgi:hypothetical protein